MNWDCDQVEERLSDYIDGLLRPDDVAAFRAHLPTCSYCKALVEGVGDAVGMMRGSVAPEPPDSLYAKILHSTSGENAKAAPQAAAESGARANWKKWLDVRGWFGAEGILWEPRFAMGAVTVVASFMILYHGIAKSPNRSSFAVLNPAVAFQQVDRQAHLAYAHTAKFVSNQRLVYEIESRLQPEPAPAVYIPEQSDPNRQQPGSPRSEKRAPQEHRRLAQNGSLFAALAPAQLFVTPTRSIP